MDAVRVVVLDGCVAVRFIVRERSCEDNCNHYVSAYVSTKLTLALQDPRNTTNKLATRILHRLQ